MKLLISLILGIVTTILACHWYDSNLGIIVAIFSFLIINNVELKKVDTMFISRIKTVTMPQRGTSKSAGIDFFVPDDFITTEIMPNTSIRIGSGIRAKIPENHTLIAFNKSSIALSGLQVGACVVDADYQGEINLHLFNVSDKPITIKPRMKLTQFILIPISYARMICIKDKDMHVTETERGANGFGSTG